MLPVRQYRDYLCVCSRELPNVSSLQSIDCSKLAGVTLTVHPPSLARHARPDRSVVTLLAPPKFSMCGYNSGSLRRNPIGLPWEHFGGVF
jgi:hypothetical protein